MFYFKKTKKAIIKEKSTNYALLLSLFLLVLTLTACSTLEDEVKDLPISYFIQSPDDTSLETVIENYKYLKDVRYQYGKTEMGEFVTLILSINLKHDDYLTLYGNTHKGRFDILISMARTTTSISQQITVFPGSQLLLIAGYNSPVRYGITNSQILRILTKIHRNEIITLQEFKQ